MSIERTDCYAYNGTSCYALKEMICKKQDCPFYRTDLSQKSIEFEIQENAKRNATNCTIRVQGERWDEYQWQRSHKSELITRNS